jgi:hypothetical protein
MPTEDDELKDQPGRGLQGGSQGGVDLDRELLRVHLQNLLGPGAAIVDMHTLGETGNEDVKRFGYGTAIDVTFRVNDRTAKCVFQTVRPGPHGHETMPDRAQLLLSNYETFSKLPRHARALDVGIIRESGRLTSLGDAREFFILTEHLDGEGHQGDFFRMRDTGEVTRRDFDRADALCDYLATIHAVRNDDPGLYHRRIRELVGHGECIMGLSDGYPDRHGFIDRGLLEGIEHQTVAWRWKLKDYTHRLCQVHGDFHPWNILFADDRTPGILDRSRGEWGEAADDVSCLTVNYLFFSLQRSGRLDGGFRELFERFWDRYIAARDDAEILNVVAPFFAFRGLVIASPVWYPDLGEDTRRLIFTFIRNVMDADSFDPRSANAYCET